MDSAAREITPQYSPENELGLKGLFYPSVHNLVKDHLATNLLRAGNGENAIMKSRIHPGGSLPTLTNTLK